MSVIKSVIVKPVVVDRMIVCQHIQIFCPPLSCWLEANAPADFIGSLTDTAKAQELANEAFVGKPYPFYGESITVNGVEYQSYS